MTRLWIAAALIAVSSAQAQAKDRGSAEPVVVEVIGTGAADLKATAARLSVSYVGRGKTTTAAEAAKAQKEAAVLRLLTAEGVPATAVGPLSPTDQAKMALSTSVLTEPTETPSEAEESSGGRTIELSSAAQASAIAGKLRGLGVQVGDPQPSFDGPSVKAARRDARLAAVTDARAGAERYAASLGLHVGPVRRISETGGYGMLPGLQEKVGAIVATNGQGLVDLMQTLIQPPKETVKVEESVVAEFALQP